MKEEPEQAPKTEFKEGWEKERKFQRSECDLNARYHHRGRWRQAKAITLSAGGVFLACRPQKLMRNDLVDLVLEMENKKFSAISRVVWVNTTKSRNSNEYGYPPGFAVEFEKIQGEDRAAIDDFIKRSLRTLHALVHELNAETLDREKIRELFLSIHPNDSTRLNHIRKSVKHGFRHFRLRKEDAY